MAASGSIRYVVRSLGRPRRQIVLSLSTCRRDRVKVTRRRGLSIGVERGGLKKLAALPRWPGFAYCSDNAATDSLGLVRGSVVPQSRRGVDPAVEGNWRRVPLHPRWEESTTEGRHVGGVGLVGWRGKRQRRGPSCSRHPSRMLWPSGWMTDTAVLVKMILQPRSANGPKPMREWGKVGITWPCIAAGGRDGAEARVALATDRSGRPFATRTPTVGALWLRFATGAPGAK